MVLAVAAGVSSSCTFTTTNGGGSPGLPSLASVVGDRFVSAVALDNGALVVEPPGVATTHISAEKARTMFRAADVVDGPYRFSVLGLGVTTISPPASAPTTTTAGTATTTTSAGTGSGPSRITGPSTTSTTTTTSTPVTTTTSAGTGASSTSTSTTVAPPLARYDHHLAWVGIAWGTGCPTTRKSLVSTRYVVVVLDAATGGSVIAYTSRGASTCTGPVEPARVSRPAELVSVPWAPVGPASTAVRVTMPPCGAFYGWTDAPTPAPASIQVVARAPFPPDCGSNAPVTQVVDGVVPLGDAQARLPHAAVGPLNGLRTLAGA